VLVFFVVDSVDVRRRIRRVQRNAGWDRTANSHCFETGSQLLAA